jgi:large conductance mechanosensitive channel
MWKDFKAFALKGNVMDLAVGVIIGGAFGKIVSSLVNDVIMPLVGLLLGGMDFSALKFVLTPAVIENGVTIAPENALLYGQFMQNVVDFLIIAASVFLMIRLLNRAAMLRKKKEERVAAAAPAKPSSEELLTEIRDLLKAK